ncbi:MAG: hypothetical protein IJ876_07465 [Elusimicrobiaceae bacterium]|nr:hypothetical protein [Elusimicrobiaceae bacterium]
MKKFLVFILFLGALTPVVWAGDKSGKSDAKVVSAAAEKAQFKARRKLVKQLIKKYKKAPESEKPAIKAELMQVVGRHVDAQLAYMKNRIAAERVNLDNWEKKIAADEKDLDAVKAKRVEDLLSGEAAKKQKAARKAWRQQMRQVKK